jgi:hypothetical protein
MRGAGGETGGATGRSLHVDAEDAGRDAEQDVAVQAEGEAWPRQTGLRLLRTSARNSARWAVAYLSCMSVLLCLYY